MKHILALTIGLFATVAHAADVGTVTQPVQEVLRTYCDSCHGGNQSEGEVRLDTIPSLDATVRLDLLNTLQEQLHFNEMPPADEKQPSAAEQKRLVDWVPGSTQIGNIG